MTFWIYPLVLLALLFFALSIWIVVIMLLGVFKKNKTAPYVSSFNKELALMKEKLILQKGKKVIDLGCGDGKALRFFAKHFELKGVGYDINTLAILLGKLLNWWLGYNGRVVVKKKDFMEVDLSSFDYIYVYLLPAQLAFIEDWIWKDMEKDAVIIANSFQFSKHNPFEVICNKKGKKSIFLYRKN